MNLDYITAFNIPDKEKKQMPPERTGMISPSKFGDMMTTGRVATTQRRKALLKNLESGDISQEYYDCQLGIIKNEEYNARFGNTCKKYVAKIVSERLSGAVHQTESFKQTEWGDEYEPKAAERYEEETGNKTIISPFIEFEKGVWGGSPDRLVDVDTWKNEGEGGIEIKCPYDPANHTNVMLETLIFNSTPWETINAYKKDHAFQTLGYMMGTQRKWWDFVTYDPRQEKGLDLNIIRLYYDENLANAIRERITEINNLITLALKEINNSKIVG